MDNFLSLSITEPFLEMILDSPTMSPVKSQDKHGNSSPNVNPIESQGRHGSGTQPALQETASMATKKEEAFRNNVEFISRHFWRKNGLTFKCHWEGFDVATEEPMNVAVELGSEALSKYLGTCSMRDKTTILNRHNCLGLLLAKKTCVKQVG